MTFFEAVKALKNGECKGINRRSWEDSSVVWLMGMESLSICDARGIGDVEHVSREPYSPSSVHVLADDWQLVNPIPQYEDVEVVLWAKVIKRSGKVICTGDSDNKPQSVNPEYEIVELTGKFPREKKPKVMRRQELPRDSFRAGYQAIPPTAKFYAEWEE